MTGGLSPSQFSSAFDGFRTGRFFYGNLRIQETLTTIRYGIEARKGVVLILGEAGIGKTTLLQKVAAEVSANVTCIVEPDPRANFAEVLRLILRSLAVESSDADEPAMVRSCQLELRARLQKSQIVALMFDDAHHLSEQTLRHVITNFLGGSAEDPDGTLLQLVLAGRPELKFKLSQAAVFPARRRTPVVCELEPLNSQEVGAYIEHGLRSVNPVEALHLEELFDPRAVKRIALYTKGNPRSINAICERTAQVAGGSAGAVINAELIDGIARDLNLRETGFTEKPGVVTEKRGFVAEKPGFVTEKINVEKHFERPEEIDFSAPHIPLAADDDVGEAVGRTFLHVKDNYDQPYGAMWPATRKRSRVPVLALLLIIGGVGAWTGADTARDSLAYWSGTLNGIVTRWQRPQSVASESESGLDAMATTALREPPPAPAIISPPPDLSADLYSGSDPAGSDPAPAPSEPSLEALAGENSAGSSLNRDPKSLPRVPAPSNQERRGLVPLKDRGKKDLALQISKAIERRAIAGVRVAIVGQDIAYLDGRVATLRQKRAAERAARSVPEVRGVRNRIIIE